jgi:hypothetical protein
MTARLNGAGDIEIRSPYGPGFTLTLEEAVQICDEPMRDRLKALVLDRRDWYRLGTKGPQCG